MYIGEPEFEHDCNQCKFLGHYKKHDLYSCSDTIIARFSDYGPDYISGLVFGKSDYENNLGTPLAQAYWRTKFRPFYSRAIANK